MPPTDATRKSAAGGTPRGAVKDEGGSTSAAVSMVAAYGVHWFVIGWNRLHGADGRASLGMTVGFLLISILGIIVFFGAHDDPVGGLFIGLTGVYVSDVFATVKADLPEKLACCRRRAARVLLVPSTPSPPAPRARPPGAGAPGRC